MKIFLLIPSLEPGGAEGQLVLLANALARRGHQITVLQHAPGGALVRELVGVRVLDLGKRSRSGLPAALARLVALLRRERPDVLHGYLPVSNLLACVAGLFCPGVRIVFGLRASNMRMDDLGLAGRLAYGLERRLSPLAALIIVNSRAGLEHAKANGFPWRKLALVPNAVDAIRCEPDSAAAARLRQAWGVPQDAMLIGVVARMDPMKDQLGFVHAAAILARSHPDSRFVLVGGGLEDYARQVRAAIEATGLGERFTLTGKLSGMPGVYAALDVLCQSSAYGEGFPNVVAEALCSGTPCVVTGVGDAPELAALAGRAALVVPPGDPSALAQGLADMLQRNANEPEVLRHEAQSALADFSPEILAKNTEELLQLLI